MSFTGFPVAVGYAAIVAIVLGVVLLAIGEPPELAEVLAPIVNVISYARIMAVLLAKGGMALAVNLLAFGAYIDEGGEGSFHFIFSADYLEYVQNHPGDYELVFAGITTAFDPASIGAVGILALVGGIVVAVVGHIVVLALGSPPPAFRRCVSSTWSSSGTSTRAAATRTCRSGTTDSTPPTSSRRAAFDDLSIFSRVDTAESPVSACVTAIPFGRFGKLYDSCRGN